MLQETLAVGVDLQRRTDTPPEGGVRASGQLAVTVVLFIVLAGIWAWLRVSPSRGLRPCDASRATIQR
jgi:hypothetical protein